MSARLVLRCTAASAAALAALASAAPAAAYCPCYTASSAYNDHSCAIEAANGTNPTDAEWNAIFDLVSKGPAAWGDAGPTVDDIGQGCGNPEPLHSVPARFPCELLKAITRVESGWRQFCVPDLPDDQVGGASRTIISFDCGYGVGQVTSGMHDGETPSFDRERVASDATYNLATGTRILASKWIATECVGDNQPTIVEDWYTATWAYNGLAYVNNPSNPNYDANRGVWDPDVGGAAPYQEKVFGWMEHTGGHWDAVALAYPNPGDVGGSGSPPALPEPSCASPTDCQSTRSTHVTQCIGGQGGAGGAGGDNGAGGTDEGGAPGEGGDAGTGGQLGGVGVDAEGEAEGDCGCRTTPAAPASGAALVALVALAAAMRRRQRGSSPSRT